VSSSSASSLSKLSASTLRDDFHSDTLNDLYQLGEQPSCIATSARPVDESTVTEETSSSSTSSYSSHTDTDDEQHQHLQQSTRNNLGLPRVCSLNIRGRVPLSSLTPALVDEWSIESLSSAEHNDVESMLLVGQSMLDEDGWGQIKYNPMSGKYWLTRAMNDGCHQAKLLLKYYFPTEKINNSSQSQSLSRSQFNAAITSEPNSPPPPSAQKSIAPVPQTGRGGLMSGFLKFFSSSSSSSSSSPPSFARRAVSAH